MRMLYLGNSRTISAPPVVPPPFSPADLPGLVAYYDASDLASITASAGAVSQWSDKSGHGNHVTQATGSAQPITGTATINAKNAIRFDGTNDILNGASGVTIASQPFTTFAVYRQTNTNNGRIWDAGSRALYNATMGPGSPIGIYAGGAANVAQIQNTSPVCHLAVFNGATSKVQVDAALTSALNPGTAILQSLFVGAFPGSHAAVDFATFAICTGDQSASFPDFLAYSRSVWGTP